MIAPPSKSNHKTVENVGHSSPSSAMVVLAFLRITKARNERNKEEITWPKRVITTTVTLAAAAAVPTSKMTIWVDCKNENSRLRNFSHKPAKTTSALISTSIPSSSSSSSSSSSQSSTTTTTKKKW
uniref:Uncharacterized protein n=1 Tax=Glossina austeni TaxID=7395 RepID=A0A1A9V0N1_GLOAU